MTVKVLEHRFAAVSDNGGMNAAGWTFVVLVVLAMALPVLMLVGCIVFGIAGAVLAE